MLGLVLGLFMRGRGGMLGLDGMRGGGGRCRGLGGRDDDDIYSLYV